MSFVFDPHIPETGRVLTWSEFETSGSKFVEPRSARAEKEATQLSDTEGGEPVDHITILQDASNAANMLITRFSTLHGWAGLM
jgi:hypothetical protein